MIPNFLQGYWGSARVTAVAIAFEERSSHIEALVRRPLSTAELGSRLAALLPLSATALGQLMLRIGRYDYVPTDALAARSPAASPWTAGGANGARRRGFLRFVAPLGRVGLLALGLG